MKEKTVRPIFVTGGHITPALAVIDELVKQIPEAKIIFIGRKYAMEGDTHISEEYRLITEKGIRFIPLHTGRLQRQLTIYSLLSLLKIPWGCINALWYSVKERPQLIVSFGGYIALPVVLAAWVCRIPILTHEQTRVIGLANKIIAHVAKKICVSFPDQVHIDSHKIIYTGLPLRKSIFHPPSSPSFAASLKMPVLFITGGATGAVSLNKVIFDSLNHLTTQYTVIHQTGERSIKLAQLYRKKLSSHEQTRYMPFSYLSGEDVSWLLHHAHIVLGRSGANTVSELAYCARVSILIPLPWSAGQEQMHNATVLQDAGAAIILPQQEYSTERLQQALADIEQEYKNFSQAAKKISSIQIHDAAQRVVKEITTMLV